jgi:Putative transposase
MQDSLPAGGLRLYREGVEPSGSLRKVSGYISILLSRTFPVARVVYAKKPFAGPQAVLAYLARYTHRVAISNRRLISADETGVTFKWKDYRIEGPGRYNTMTLPTHEFIRRFLTHVLPKGLHRIRHYGLFANGNRAANIAQARELLGVPSRSKPTETSDTATADKPRALPRPCRCCGGRMIIIETFAGGCQPKHHSAPATAAIRIDTS